MLLFGVSISFGQPYNCTVTINSGVLYTATNNVSLILTATDATTMNISNTGYGQGVDETYNSAKSWALTIGNGLKSVYVQFSSATGNVNAPLANITLDDTRPGVPGSLSPVSWTSVNAVGTLTFGTASDSGGSGIAHYEIFWGTDRVDNWATDTIPNQANSPAVNHSFSPSSLFGSPAGTYYLIARAVDGASNTSNWQTVMYYQYDGTPPGLPSTLNNVISTSNNIPGTIVFGGASDNVGGSGIDHYEIYWGTNSWISNPTEIVANMASTLTNEFNPGYISVADTYYLIVRAIDKAGNGGTASDQWQTIMSYDYNGDGAGVLLVNNQPISPLYYSPLGYITQGSQKNAAYYLNITQTANISGSSMVLDKICLSVSGSINLANISLKLYEDTGVGLPGEISQFFLSTTKIENNRVTLDVLQVPFAYASNKNFYLVFNLAPTSDMTTEAFSLTLLSITAKYWKFGTSSDATVFVTGNGLTKTFSISGMQMGYNAIQPTYLCADDTSAIIITFNIKPYLENSRMLSIDIKVESNQTMSLGTLNLTALFDTTKSISMNVSASCTIALTSADMYANNTSYDYKLIFIPNPNLPAGTTLNITIQKVYGQGNLSNSQTNIWSTLPSFNIYLAGLSYTIQRNTSDSILIGGMSVPILKFSARSYFCTSTLNYLSIFNNSALRFSKNSRSIQNVSIYQDINTNNSLDDSDWLISQTPIYNFTSPNEEISITIDQAIATYNSLNDEKTFFINYDLASPVDAGLQSSGKITNLVYSTPFSTFSHSLLNSLTNSITVSFNTGIADIYFSSYNVLCSTFSVLGETLSPIMLLKVNAINNVAAYSLRVSNNLSIFTGNDYGIKQITLVEDIDNSQTYSLGDKLHSVLSTFNSTTTADLTLFALKPYEQNFILLFNFGSQIPISSFSNNSLKISVSKIPTVGSVNITNIAGLFPFPKPERAITLTSNLVSIELLTVTPTVLQNSSDPHIYATFRVNNQFANPISISNFSPQLYKQTVGSLNLSYQYQAISTTSFPVTLEAQTQLTVSFIISPNQSFEPGNLWLDANLNYSYLNKTIVLSRTKITNWGSIVSGSTGIRINIPTYNVFYQEIPYYISHMERDSYGVTYNFRNKEIISRGDYLSLFFINEGKDINLGNTLINYATGTSTNVALSAFTYPALSVDSNKGIIKIGPLDASQGSLSVAPQDLAGNAYPVGQISFYDNTSLFINDFLVYPSKLIQNNVQTNPLKIGFLLSKAATTYIYLFNSLGEMVWNITQTHNDFGYKLINFDGILNSGELIPKGIYIIKIVAKELSGQQNAKSLTKFIVM